MSKYKSYKLIDYIPFVGPAYNAAYALNLLLNIWPMNQFASLLSGTFLDPQPLSLASSDGEELFLDEPEKDRQIREKGVIAIVGSFIDLFAVCLSVGVMAYVSTCLSHMETPFLVRHTIFLLIFINIFPLTIAAKIIVNQLALYATRQLEDVNQVGTSMFKSATLTVSAIERIVETTNQTSEQVVATCNHVYNWTSTTVYNVKMFPTNVKRALVAWIEERVRRLINFAWIVLRVITLNQVGRRRRRRSDE